MDTTYQDIHILNRFNETLLVNRKVMVQNIEFVDGIMFIVYTDENKINYKLEVPMAPGIKLVVD